MLGQLKRWRWTLALIGALLLGLGYSLWPAAIRADVGRVTRGPMSVGVTDDGVTRAQEVYTVSAPVSGYARRIGLKVGDRVTQGDLVTEMTGRPSMPLDQRSREVVEGTLDAARATVRGAEVSLAQSQRDLQRAERLAASGFLPPAQLEAVRTRVLGGEATLRQSHAEAARIEALLAAPGASATDRPVAVRAPASGSVLSVPNESAGVITEGAALMMIGDPRNIEVVVDLLSRDAVRVKPGDQVEITQWGGPGALAAQVVRIEPFGRLKISALGIEEQRVNVIIRLDQTAMQAASRLGHGYQVEATIILWRRTEALRAPIGALFKGKGGEWRVFAVRNGRARDLVVRVGQINEAYGEILSGLREGDQLVLNPSAQVMPGRRIAAR